MDDLDRIRQRLRESAADREEQDRLVALFDRACAGLESGTAKGVKAEMETRFQELLEKLEQNAETVRETIRE